MKELYCYRKFFAYAMSFYYAASALQAVTVLSHLSSVRIPFEASDSLHNPGAWIVVVSALLHVPAIVLLIKRSWKALPATIALEVGSITLVGVLGGIFPLSWVCAFFRCSIVWLAVTATESQWVALEKKAIAWWMELAKPDLPPTKDQ